MRKNYLVFGIIALLLFGSCSEDVDITAPYKDIAIVYGLLDHKDTVHYIRIQKAFLGDDNALLYCTIPDSLYYPPGLDAYILGYNSMGVKVPADSFHLERVINDVDKDSGIFAAYNNVLYKGVKVLDKHHTYELIIIKPNGDTVSARTTMAGSVSVAPVLLYLNWEAVTGTSTEPVVKFTWADDPAAYVYQLCLYFNYQEWKAGSPGIVENKQGFYNFVMFKPTDEYKCGNSQICFTVSKEHFYYMITSNVDEDPEGMPPNEVRVRKFISVDVKVTTAGQEFYDYVVINGPSLTSAVQKTTSYTNIHNGSGIFGSRSSDTYYGCQLDTQNLDSLSWGRYTHQLNFQH
jgi:hypothetical protein